MKNASAVESLSPGQAQYVLARMAEDRKINQREISEYLDRMEDEIRDLEQRLGMLKDAREGDASPAPAPAASRPASSRRSRKAAAAPAKKGTRAKPNLSPETRASRALQGRYISLIKQIPESDRPRFKTIAEKKGREEAIRKMQTALKK